MQRKKVGLLALIILALVAIPATLYLVSQQQDIRQKAFFEPDCAPGGNQIDGIVNAGQDRQNKAGIVYRVKNCSPTTTHTISADTFSCVCSTQTGSCGSCDKKRKTITVGPGEYGFFEVPSPTASCGSIQTDVHPDGLPTGGFYANLQACTTTPPPSSGPTSSPSASVTPDANPVPNCRDLTGPSQIYLGETASFSATFVSQQGQLAGSIDAMIQGDTTPTTSWIWANPNRKYTGVRKTDFFTWKPGAVGTYLVFCRAWNDSIAECRGHASAVDGKPRYTCNGPQSSMLLTVIASPSATPTPTPTATPTPRPTNTPTPTPTLTPTPTVTPTPIPNATPTPTLAVTPTPTSSPSATPTPTTVVVVATATPVVIVQQPTPVPTLAPTGSVETAMGIGIAATILMVIGGVFLLMF